MDTQSILADYLTREIAVGRARQIGPDDDLIASGILDSLGLMQLVLFIEESLSLKIPDEEVVIDNFRTVRILAEYIDQNRPQAAA